MTIPDRLLCALGGVLVGSLAVACTRAIPGSRAHPLVASAGAAFMFFLGPQCTSLYSAGLGVMFFTVVLVVAICDWSILRIPNVVVAAGACAALGMLSLGGIGAAGSRAVSAVASGATMLALYMIGAALFRREAMGFGDVKLGAMLGCYLELEGFLLCLWLAALFGLLAVLICETIDRFGVHATGRLNCRQKWGPRGELPFGSFLCMSAAVVYLFGDTLLPMVLSFLMPLW